MEIYEQIALGGQLWILFKSIVLIIFLFLAGYPLFPRRTGNIHLKFAIRIGLSLIFISSLFAIVHTHGRSALLPFAVVLVILLFANFKTRCYKRIELKEFFNLQIAFLLLIFVLLFAVNSFLTQPYDNQGITVINLDISTYANWTRQMMESGTETLPQEMLSVKSKQSFYHFIDLWFVGWASKALDINGYVFYSIVYKPLLQFVLLLFITGFAKRLKLSKGLRLLAVFILFSTALYPFLSFNAAPWYLDMWYTSFPLYHYIGTYFVSIYLFLILSAFWFFRNERGAIVLISLLGLVNPILIAVVPLFFLMVLSVSFLPQNSKIVKFLNVVNRENRNYYFLGFIVSSLIVVFFKIFIVGNESNGVLDVFKVKTYLVAGNIFARIIITSIIYSPLYVVGYAYLLKYCPKYKNAGVLLLYLFLSGAVFVSLVFENVQGDIGQITKILWNVPLIVIGSFGFLLMIHKAENHKTKLIALILINSMWGVYNTFSEHYSSFNPVYKFNHQGVHITYKDIDALNEITRNHGYLGGYFLNPAEKTRSFVLSDFVAYNAFTNDYSISYRLNAVSYDEVNSLANRVYRNSVLYDLNKESLAEKPAAAVEKLQVNWLIVNNNRFFMPPELKSSFTKEYKFDGFSVFVKSNDSRTTSAH